ncbi:MAG: hypothetical protein HC803_03165 [Saprospiraceae bacterium]|nr:hypothetical protein [Saprospiraceae bacterium]
MKTYTLLLTMVSILFLTNCNTSTKDADSQSQQVQQSEGKTEQKQEVLKDATVWAAEMDLDGEAKKGTVTFFEGDKIKVKDGVSDKTYTYKYIDSGAAIELTNVDNTEETLYFMLTDATETEEVWESVDADVQAVWTLTKE